MLPEVPVRQWVLSLPFALRYRLAYDARLVSEVLRIFVSVIRPIGGVGSILSYCAPIGEAIVSCP